MSPDMQALEVPQEIWSLVADFLPNLEQRGRIRRVCRAARAAELMLPVDKEGFMGAWRLVAADAFVCTVASSLRHFKNASLRELDLRTNRLSDAGGVALGAALGTTPSPPLQLIDLRENRLGDPAACALGGALRVNCELRVLRLGSNSITDEGAIAIGAALAANHHGALQGLDLAANALGNGAARALAAALCEAAASSLHELDLSWNQVGSAGALALSEALVGGAHVLGELRLTSNLLIDSNGWLALRKAKATAQKATLRPPLRIFGRNGTLISAFSDRDAEKGGGRLADAAHPRGRPPLPTVRLKLSLSPLGQGVGERTDQEAHRRAGAVRSQKRQQKRSRSKTREDTASRDGKLGPPRHKENANVHRQLLLREERRCEHCGALWPPGSITYNSYQSYRSRCSRHGIICRTRPTYLAKGSGT